MDRDEQQKHILKYLENAYTGARMFDDLETMVRLARAIEAFKLPVVEEPEKYGTFSYRGFRAAIDYSEEDKVYHGKIAGISDLITFESETEDGIEQSFHDAVDEYMQLCIEIGK